MAKDYTFDELCREITGKTFAPVYVLMGEEPYFIDEIEELLVQNVLSAADRDFNQSVFYGADSKVEDIINAARRFPMMAERQLVIIKEAQDLNKLDMLSHYVKKPMPATVLVICHKYKKLDGRKSLTTEAKKTGVVFESKKIYDDKMPDYIMSFMKRRAMQIDEKSVQMLADSLGNDLGRLAKETDKLQLLLADSPSKQITPELIEKNIGISKDYNKFELVNAIALKDVLRAYRIANYLGNSNQKTNAIQAVLPTLFDYFVNLMICLYAKDRSERGIMQTLKLQWPFQAKNYMFGLRNYNAMNVYNIIHELRLADAKSKGFENSSETTDDIYKKLLYKILLLRS